jgi:hypothetical protein
MSDFSQLSFSIHQLTRMLNGALPYAEQVMETLPPENTHDQWRLFKLISDMRDIINNPPKV